MNWQLLRDLLCYDPASAHDIIEYILKNDFNRELQDKYINDWAEGPIKDCSCAISERGFMHCFKISLDSFYADLDAIWNDFLEKLHKELESEIR